MTQADAAKLFGVSRTTIANWESGTKFPKIDRLLMIADAYGVTVDDLLREDD